MKICLEIQLQEECISIDWRPLIISFFRNCLHLGPHKSYLNQYYGFGKEKPFAFAANFGNATFVQDLIHIPSRNFKIHFGTSDTTTALVFYNTFIDLQGKQIVLNSKNTFKIVSLQFENETKISTNAVLITFLSPLCIRSHTRDTNQDRYYTFKEEAFLPTLKSILRYQCSNMPRLHNMIESFECIPVEPKVLIVKHYQQKFACSLGTYRLIGQPPLLNYLYQQGMGSRHSAGFGYFKVIQT